MFECPAHLGDEPGKSLEQIVLFIPDDLEVIALGRVIVEFDGIDRDAGSEQAGAQLLDMREAIGVVHGQRAEIDVLEVDESTAAGGLEVETAAAQEAGGRAALAG